jgi:hypothetical protein
VAPPNSGRMKAIRDAGLLFRRSLTELLRNLVSLAVSFSAPVLYLALFTARAGSSGP